MAEAKGNFHFYQHKLSLAGCGEGRKVGFCKTNKVCVTRCVKQYVYTLALGFGGGSSVSTRVVLGSILFINVSDSENSSPVSKSQPLNQPRIRNTVTPSRNCSFSAVTRNNKGLLILPNIVLFAFITLTWVRIYIQCVQVYYYYYW